MLETEPYGNRVGTHCSRVVTRYEAASAYLYILALHVPYNFRIQCIASPRRHNRQSTGFSQGSLHVIPAAPCKSNQSCRMFCAFNRKHENTGDPYQSWSSRTAHLYLASHRVEISEPPLRVRDILATKIDFGNTHSSFLTCPVANWPTDSHRQACLRCHRACPYQRTCWRRVLGSHIWRFKLVVPFIAKTW